MNVHEMIEALPKWWVLEWSSKGGIALHTLGDVLRRNWERRVAGLPVDWVPVGMFPDFARARVGLGQARRARAQARAEGGNLKPDSLALNAQGHGSVTRKEDV